MCSPRVSSGFTVIEILVVIAIIAVISVFAAPYLSNTLIREDVDVSAQRLVDALREAQSSVMSGREDARWGVHLEGQAIVLFSGAAYSAADPDNVAYTLNAQVSITDVTITPGAGCTLPAGTGDCDVHFASHKGVPTESGTVTFLGADGATKIVTVNGQGMIDIQ